MKNNKNMQLEGQMTIWEAMRLLAANNYTVKSLFSGAGGLDCGLEQAGLKVVESYEFEKKACDTLAKASKGDVYKCDISKLLLEEQMKTYVITATFPCTHFSTAGLRDGDELYLEAHRIIRCLEPEVFVIENVPAMKKFDIVMEAFLNMPGYHVKDFIINAKDCGAPQNRKRLIIMGSKSEFDWDFTPVPESEKKYLKDILEEGVDMPLSKCAANRLAGVNKGQWAARIYDPNKDDYGPTCVAHYAKDQGDQLTIDPLTGKVRSFTELEYGRLQGFPDNYPFQGGKVATLKQIGNAVSPAMARVIGKEILRYSKEISPSTENYNNIHHTFIKKEIIA